MDLNDDENSDAQQNTTAGQSTLDSRPGLNTNASKNAGRTRSGILSVLGKLISDGRAWISRSRHQIAEVHQLRPLPPPGPPGSIVRRLNEYEAFDGYPKLAVFQDSDPSFMVYRRFGFLSTRVLLDKQDELRVLEERLNVYDQRNTVNGGTTNIHGEELEARRAILDKIEASFKSYSSMLLSAQHLMAFNRPSDAEHRSVSNFLHYKRPIHAKQRVYINHKEDLITLRPDVQDDEWLGPCLEYLLRKLRRPFPRIARLYCDKDALQKNVDPDVTYTSLKRVNRCASVSITAVILALLVVPIYILYELVMRAEDISSERTTGLCIGVLLIATLAFTMVLTFFTRAKRHEVLAAAAAYCAVLVVFFGNIKN